MLLRSIAITICILCLPVSSPARDNSPVTVTEMVFCTEIKNRTPIGMRTNFPDSVEQVYCFTRLSSTQDQTSISHVWYYNDVQMAIVDLPVNARSWRTWSSKRIVRDWTGVWRVDVISATGHVICTEDFTVSPSSDDF